MLFSPLGFPARSVPVPEVMQLSTSPLSERDRTRAYAAHIYVISVTHLIFGAVAVKSRSKMLGATGCETSLLVVSTRRRLRLAHNPASRISLATRLREQLLP